MKASQVAPREKSATSGVEYASAVRSIESYRVMPFGEKNKKTWVSVRLLGVHPFLVPVLPLTYERINLTTVENMYSDFCYGTVAAPPKTGCKRLGQYRTTLTSSQLPGPSLYQACICDVPASRCPDLHDCESCRVQQVFPLFPSTLQR